MSSGSSQARLEGDDHPSTPYSTEAAFRVPIARDAHPDSLTPAASGSGFTDIPVTPTARGQLPPLVYHRPVSGPVVTGYRAPSIYYASPYPSAHPFHLLPPRNMVEASTQTEPETVDLLIRMAVDFASTNQNWSWPPGVTIETEDRLLVALRAIKKAGFHTLGAFLAHAFDNASVYNKHPTVYHTIASFLQAKNHAVDHHPAAIVDLIFHHKKLQDIVAGVRMEPNFTLPRYALNPVGPIPSPNATSDALLNWSLHCVMERVEKETKQLLQPRHGFLHRPNDRKKRTLA
ncbi:hypothetical protein R3P38DRAFT_3227789 [Favolaschia claudopus]|uniref:Uncharacterized protein n=1 Tax=Favolaschia claudopus TaxID=2862362 RepID=A0AAV9ZRL2_9AGAR